MTGGLWFDGAFAFLNEKGEERQQWYKSSEYLIVMSLGYGWENKSSCFGLYVDYETHYINLIV